MDRYVALSLLIICEYVRTAPPVRLTIDCGSDEGDSYDGFNLKSRSSSDFNIDSFCSMIQKAIPKAIKDGRFILANGDSDQSVLGNALAPLSVSPPNGFIPKFPKLLSPKLKIPKINVPALLAPERPLSPPRLGSPKTIAAFRDTPDEETSAEKMEKFKKGVQKMLHVVKVLGQVDQYLSERTRIIIDKLSKTLAE